MGKGSILKGSIIGVKNNFYQREIANASYQFQRELEAKEQIQVGVNKYKFEGKTIEPPELIKISDEVSNEQIKSLNNVKAQRDEALAQKSLEKIKEIAQGTENLIPYILDAVKAYCSVGEIIDVLRKIFTVYREESIF
jgi:methylmalonyl-CoA mutase N-terminal domain/subunit